MTKIEAEVRVLISTCTQVEYVVPSGPAYIAGVLRGDVIMACDGSPVDDTTITKRIRGDDSIGSECTLTISRKGVILVARLARTSDFSLKRASELISMIEKQAETGDFLFSSALSLCHLVAGQRFLKR